MKSNLAVHNNNSKIIPLKNTLNCVKIVHINKATDYHRFMGSY